MERKRVSNKAKRATGVKRLYYMHASASRYARKRFKHFGRMLKAERSHMQALRKELPRVHGERTNWHDYAAWHRKRFSDTHKRREAAEAEREQTRKRYAEAERAQLEAEIRAKIVSEIITR
jgi:hypothetical protein